MGNNILMARKIRVNTAIRCDFDHGIIPKGKYATQVVGDPKEIKAQGIFHGRICYENALAKYNELKDQMDMQEEAENV